MSTGTRIILKKGSGEPDPLDLEIAELAVDVVSGDLYTKLQSSEVKNLTSGVDDGTGSSVHIGDTPPDNPEEGQQWMEVPASGEATMWIYDGAKWLQHPSGKDGAAGADGNIADATTEGVVATWDDTAKQWTPDSNLTIDATGNATFSGTARFETWDNPLMLRSGEDAYSIGAELRDITGGSAACVVYDAWQTHYFKNGDPAHTRELIYCDGNATFSGTVTAKGDATYSAGLISNSFDSAGWARLDLRHQHSGTAMVFLDAEGQLCFKNDADKSTSFPGREGSYRFMDPAGTQVAVITRTGDATFSGRVSDSTGPLMSSRHLIETLSTLRNATKDETTIKGLRDAIGNAVGGLIEKFEAMQSTATQEISDE